MRALPLTPVETLLLRSILRRDAEITEAYVRPLRDEFVLLLAGIAERLDLPVDDFGQRCQLDVSAEVVLVAEDAG